MLVIFGAMAVILAAATMAFACTPRQNITHITPMASPPGKSVTVQGEGLNPGVPVAIRWNGMAGPSLASGNADAAGNYSVTANIPETGPGIYFIIATAGDAQATVARSAFEVLAAPGDSAQQAVAATQASLHDVSPDLWRGFSSASSNLGQGADSSTAPASALGLGLGIALSSAAAMTGFAAVVIGRRRATAGSR